MSNYILLKRVRLKASHPATGFTRHYDGNNLLPTPSQLQIVKYPQVAGYYLLYLDEHGNEMTDTYHDTLEQAHHQAELEFQVKSHEWEILDSTHDEYR